MNSITGDRKIEQAEEKRVYRKKPRSDKGSQLVVSEATTKANKRMLEKVNREQHKLE